MTHMRQLPPMAWASSARGSGGGFSNVLPWQPTAATVLRDEAAQKEAQMALSNMAKLRLRAPQLYMSNSMQIQTLDSNFAVRYSDNDGVIAVERWYPRRHVLVTVANLGPAPVTLDLSSLYYGGRVVVSYPKQQTDYMPFRGLHLQPGQAFVVELDK
ncbi:hypothetical protein B566_EDAN014030 [Ephemera danica]|nr:hypothetical protein B566_EDAN014030 [Ephemera danica]